MKQTNFIQTKLNYLPRPSTHMVIDQKSIDVDTVKVYEIKDEKESYKPILLQPIQIENQSSAEKLSQLPLQQCRKGQTLKKEIREDKYGRKHDLQDSLNGSIKTLKKSKPVPFCSFMQKLQKTVNYFLSIKQPIQFQKITSQQFYNLFHLRKKLLSINLISPRQLFEGQYTNILSFLSYLIRSKQKEFQIYEQLEQIQKILGIVERQIEELTEIYLAEEQKKIQELFSEEFVEEIQKICAVCDSVYGKQIETLNIEKKQEDCVQILIIEEQVQPIPIEEHSQKNPIEEGEINLHQLSKSSIHSLPLSYLQKSANHKNQPLIETNNNPKQLSIEIKSNIEELQEQMNDQKAQQNIKTQCNKLISSFEEKQIFKNNDNQKIFPDQQLSQKCKTSSNHMEIQEQI